MRLAGNRAEVGECCAERRLKSKLNYASHRFGNSIATVSRENRGEAVGKYSNLFHWALF
jgi:hypothetical protein